MLPTKKDSLPPDPALAAQAARIEELMHRWDAEGVSDEPDWDVKDIERICFSFAVVCGGDSESPQKRGPSES